MPSCIHGTQVGNYCNVCMRVIRPSREEILFQHYMYHMAPIGTCEKCDLARKVAQHARESRQN